MIMVDTVGSSPDVSYIYWIACADNEHYEVQSEIRVKMVTTMASDKRTPRPGSGSGSCAWASKLDHHQLRSVDTAPHNGSRRRREFPMGR